MRVTSAGLPAQIATAREQVDTRGAEGAAADNADGRGGQPLLARLTDAGEAGLPRVAVHRPVGAVRVSLHRVSLHR